ncbi:MAG: KH domain-containing protein [Coriobacteriales bacterium]
MVDSFEDVTQLVRTLVEQIVENPEAATVTGTDQENGELFIEIEVDEGDIGKIIGRQGRIIKAIRTLARAAASQDGFRVEVELAE